jgi:hypothetical protein
VRAELMCTLLLIIVTSNSGSWAVAESTGINNSNPDSLEYQLEIQGHEALGALKNNFSSQLNDFTSDGCSGGLSIGWQYLAGKVQKFEELHGMQPPWESCCISHDREYHPGGGREISAGNSYTLRKSADQLLKSCVQKIGTERSRELGSAYGISSEEVERLYGLIAGLMYRSVRIGGMPCTGLPWRWGYGWPECE